MTENHSLVVYNARTAMEVDDAAANAQAAKLMKHAGTGMFPKDLSPAQSVELARMAMAYGLDPFAGEIMVYQGRLYVGIDGRMRKANEHPMFEGIECVPATDAERKAFRCDDAEHLWVARVWRRDRRVPAVGYGRAGARDKNPVSQTHAQEMAQKRAKHRALRDAFALPIPGVEESDGEAWTSARELDYRTGEIIDAESVEPADAVLTTIRPDQITAIHVQVGSIKWPDAQYREVLQGCFGVTTSKDLTEGQASALLEMLEAVGDRERSDAAVAGIKERLRASGWKLSDFWDAGIDDTPPESPRQVPATPPEPSPRDVPNAADFRDDPPPTPAQLSEYDGLMKRAEAMGLDLVDYQTNAKTSGADLARIVDQLTAAVERSQSAQTKFA